MFHIIKIDGTEIGITDKVNYIKIGASGSFTPAAEAEAVGVAFGGVPYNLVGHNEIEGAETVVVAFSDGGAELMTLYAQHIEAEQMITELDIANIEAQQTITDLELMILEG